MVCLDALTRRAGAHVLPHSHRQGWPPHQAASQGHRLVTAKVSAQRSCMQLVQHLGLKRAGHAKAVAARAETVEEPFPPGEDAPRGKRRRGSGMIEFFLPNSRALLPTFRANCPGGSHFAQMGSDFAQKTTTNPCSLLSRH